MFLPWLGFFEQVKLAESFVFLDDVQLPLGRSFIHRVQIKTARGQEWLSAPVMRAGRAYQTIRDTQFDGNEWRQRHLALLERTYRPAPYFSQVWEAVVRPIYAVETSSLSQFCIEAVRRICEYLGLSPTWYASSALELGLRPDDASSRLVSICQALGADQYITGHGAANYLRHEAFEAVGVQVRYMDYHHRPYRQLYGTFVPYVSILDLLFCEGDGASAYLNPHTVEWSDWVRKSELRPA
jgi:hypothetical protein